ncbi:MAG: ribonuclease R [Candidatus Sumerlaeia bacterium]
MIVNRQTLLNFFSSRRNSPIGLSRLMAELSIPAHRREQVRTLLREMVADGTLVALRNKHFALRKAEETITGVLELHPRGFGFVRPISTAAAPHDVPDIFIPPPFIGEALNNDTVEVRVVKERLNRSEGRIVRVIERGRRFVVGQLVPDPRRPRLIPRDQRLSRQIVLLPDKWTRSLKTHTWVLAQIIEWPPAPQPLRATISEVLGGEGEPRLGVTLLIKDLGIETEFPEAVLAEAEAFPREIPPEELARRTDFRNVMTFTIDPADAKDFDDALHVRRLDDGNIELGVHIADVSHFVRPGTALDDEARRRATSIYPVDRVVPMLPERLSNDLCSLRPREDRLVMSAVAELTPGGEVKRCSFHEGVIRSAWRFAYEQVQAILDGADRAERERCPAPLVEALGLLQRLTRALIAARDRAGRLDLDIPESKALFDSEGEVRGLVRRPRLFAHRMVEECMLLANELVARHLARRRVPILYRIHEDPDIEKLNMIAGVFKHLGIVFDPERAMNQKYLQKVLKKIEGRDAGHILHTFLLRAMMRARYSPENAGHFGLASPFYCHFTSPIRRYPDLFVHRQLRAWLSATAGTKRPAPPPVEQTEGDAEALAALAHHCSLQEQKAAEVEYEAYRIKALEFMEPRLGEEFEGWVAGLTAWGLYVELVPFPVEGLIPLREMKGDDYEFDPEAVIVRGRRTGRTFRLTQPVRVWVHSIDRASQTLSLRLCDEAGGPGAGADRTPAQKQGTGKRRRGRRKSGGRQS